MQLDAFISIDQNSHALWDTVPKLHCLEAAAIPGTHCIEDVDTAFTKRGGQVGDRQLDIVRERCYRDGSSDWGASLFYSDFLGRTPVNLHTIETYTGMSTKALARSLDCSVDELYEQYAQSDNWQLVGASYADRADRHRVIGDLSLAETFPFIAHLLQHARQDVLDAFPAAPARQRINQWFEEQQAIVQQLHHTLRAGSLVRFYQAWMAEHIKAPAVRFRMTSEMFHDRLTRGALPLLSAFLDDYETMGALYNRAIRDADVGLDTLDVERGELPFFAVWQTSGRMFRTEMTLSGSRLEAGGHAWPIRGGRLPVDDCRADGLRCVVGKAVLLVLQARLKNGGAPLVLPDHGSLYMPAVHAFEANLHAHGGLKLDLHPICRVRFDFLAALGRADTMLRLPDYLVPAFGSAEMPCTEFADQLPATQAEAQRQLRLLRDDTARERAINQLDPALAAEIEALGVQQRTLARDPHTRSKASAVWDRIKELKRRQIRLFIADLLRTIHVTGLSYWNSRGALLPWSIAAGGQPFYNDLIRNARITPETTDHET